MIEQSKLKYVFIIGSKRSGTTWAMWLLTQHPGIVGFYHSGLFASLRNLETWWQTNPPYGKGIIAANSEEQTKEAPNTNNYAQLNVNELLSIQDLYGYCKSFSAGIIDKIVSCKPGAQVFLDTTPENLEQLQFILGVFPDAYIIHLIRDPRSVFSSWRNSASTWSTSTEFETNTVEFARQWHLDVSTACQAREMTNRYKEIYYESLLKDGISLLGQIYSWLELPTDESLCRKAVDACTIDKLRKNVMPGLNNFFRKGVSQGWREEISSSDIRIIEYIAGDLMEELGYECAFAHSKLNKPMRLRLNELISWILKWIQWILMEKLKIMKLIIKIRRMVK